MKQKNVDSKFLHVLGLIFAYLLAHAKRAAGAAQMGTSINVMYVILIETYGGFHHSTSTTRTTRTFEVLRSH